MSDATTEIPECVEAAKLVSSHSPVERIARIIADTLAFAEMKAVVESILDMKRRYPNVFMNDLTPAVLNAVSDYEDLARRKGGGT